MLLGQWQWQGKLSAVASLILWMETICIVIIIKVFFNGTNLYGSALTTHNKDITGFSRVYWKSLSEEHKSSPTFHVVA